MPFAYYGAKHGLAHKYPPPVGGLIIEPFAGSAGYSGFHVAHVDRVLLFDADPKVVELWHRVFALTGAELDAIEQALSEDAIGHIHPMTQDGRSCDPLVLAVGGSTSLRSGLDGTWRQITPRMRSDWPKIRRRIERTMPYLDRFEIVEGRYSDAPDVDATWHIDPPYQPLMMNETRTEKDQAGNAYRFGADELDYSELGAWCRSRRGLVMVCEQSPAAWLPFAPLATQTNGAGSGSSTRTEVIWRNDAEQQSLFAEVTLS